MLDSNGSLYRIREVPGSVKLAAVLFLLVLGASYVFAFLMVRQYSGLTPDRVAVTYVPHSMNETALPSESQSTTAPLDLGAMAEQHHRVDTNLLIQDSHIHLLIYAVVGGFLSLFVLGFEWTAGWRNAAIVAAFGTGTLDFIGQWLMKAGFPSFAWLTIASGWGMAAIYLVVLFTMLRHLRSRPPKGSLS